MCVSVFQDIRCDAGEICIARVEDCQDVGGCSLVDRVLTASCQKRQYFFPHRPSPPQSFFVHVTFLHALSSCQLLHFFKFIDRFMDLITERRPGTCPDVFEVPTAGQECPSDAFCGLGQKCCKNTYGASVCVSAGACVRASSKVHDSSTLTVLATERNCCYVFGHF